MASDKSLLSILVLLLIEFVVLTLAADFHNEEHVKRATTGGKPKPRQGNTAQETVLEEYAGVAYQAPNIAGAKAGLAIWKPYVNKSDGEYSLSQIQLLFGTHEYLGAGWIVGKDDVGNPKLFVQFSTAGTGLCWNLDCPGFVKDGKARFVPASPMSHVSQYDGTIWELFISIKRERNGGVPVWAIYAQNVRVGHYPLSLFRNATYPILTSFVGGVAVHSTGKGSRHSTTDMGSGHFPQLNYKRAAHIKQLQLFDDNGKDIIKSTQQSVIQTNPECYKAQILNTPDKVWGPIYLLMGGPGGDARGCVNNKW